MKRRRSFWGFADQLFPVFKTAQDCYRDGMARPAYQHGDAIELEAFITAEMKHLIELLERHDLEHAEPLMYALSEQFRATLSGGAQQPRKLIRAKQFLGRSLRQIRRNAPLTALVDLREASRILQSK